MVFGKLIMNFTKIIHTWFSEDLPQNRTIFILLKHDFIQDLSNLSSNLTLIIL